MKQGFELVRERTLGGVTSVEVTYGITSLDEHEASARQLLDMVRDHWKIENELHYVRDVTLREDVCRVRKGAAPQVLAAIRNTVVHLLADVEAKSRPEAIEVLQVQPDRAKQLIGLA